MQGAMTIFRGKQTPLLIGGATTSRVHTAVKIAPQLRWARSLCAGCIAVGIGWPSEPALR